MPAALHVNATTAHGQPLSPGPGSTTVFIHEQPAWRALPAGVGAGLEKATAAVKELMDASQLTPPLVLAKLPRIQADFTQSATESAAKSDNPTATSGVSSAFATLTATHATLVATWIAAQPTPGAGAATAAYTQAVKVVLSTAASAAVTAIAGRLDMSVCAAPSGAPHGPGLVTQGSTTVFIDDLPAADLGHKIFEAAGGPVEVTVPAPSVFIDD